MVYIILYLFFAATSFFDVLVGFERKKYVIFGFSVVLLIVISSIRWETGPDWRSYFFFFRDIDRYSEDEAGVNQIEAGYTFFNKIISTITTNYSIFLTCLALLTIGLKVFVLSYHKRIMMIALFLYFCYYLGDIASVRQFTSISICLFSIPWIEKKQFFPFLILIALSVSFHTSSIIFLFAYFLYHRQVSDSILYAVLVCSFLIGLVNISGLIIEFVSHRLGLSQVVIEKLLKYNEEGLGVSGGNPYISFSLGVFKRSIILPLLIWGSRYIPQQELSRYRSYLNLLVFGNVIYFLFAISVPVMTRLSVVYLFFEIFLIGYLVVNLRDAKLRFASLACVLLFGMFRLYLFLSPYMNLYLPFQTIFSDRYINRY